MNLQYDKKWTQEIYGYLEKMDRPKSFTFSRVLLARGAAGWFVNVVVALAVGVLLGMVLTGMASAPLEGVLFLAFFLLFFLILLVKRVIEPFQWTHLLKYGEVELLPIVDKSGSFSLISRIGSKRKTRYTFRYDQRPGDPVLKTKYDGALAFQGEACVVLCSKELKKPFAPGEQRSLVYKLGFVGSDQGKFFPLDCFLHHRLLTFPDLLEGEEQIKAWEAVGYGQNWKPIFGDTAKALGGRFLMATGMILALGLLLTTLLRVA